MAALYCMRILLSLFSLSKTFPRGEGFARVYPVLVGELLGEHLVDHLRVCFAARGLHDLADEGTDGLLLAALVLGDGLRVRRNRCVDGRLNGARVRDLDEALVLDNLLRVVLVRPHLLEDLLGDLAGDRVLHDETDHLAETLGADRGLRDVDAVLIEVLGEVAHDPVGRELRVGTRCDDGVEVLCHGARARDDAGIVVRQAVFLLEAGATGIRQFRQLAAVLLDCLLARDDWRQIRLRHVAVVVRVLFAAHRERDAAGRVERARLLDDVAAVLEYFLLALNLVVDGILEILEGVDVLHLRAGAELFRASRAQGDVDVGAQVAFFHAAVRDVDVLHDGLDLLHVGAGLFCRAQVRLRNNLEEWHTRAVVVDVARRGVLDGRARVNKLAGVLLHVDARQADALLLAIDIDVDPAVLSDWQVVLGRLPVLRQVRIVVVLAVELAVLVDCAVRREAGLDAELDDTLVDRRQDARQAEADRADMRVLLRAEARGAAAEDLRFRLEFAVDLKANDCFVFHQCFPPSSGICLW